MHRGLLPVLPLLIVALLAVGCSGPGSGQVVVEPTAGSVELEVGQTLVVDFGEINESVGDAWALAVEPDPAVLAVGAVASEYHGEEGMTGAPTTLTHSFEAVGRGETAIEFQFSYRGSTDTADTSERMSEPRPRLVVTVD